MQLENVQAHSGVRRRQRSDIWNHRDMLMEARLAVWTGRIDEATAILDRTLLLGNTNLGFLVECEGVRGLLPGG